jgi:hypothetical protein
MRVLAAFALLAFGCTGSSPPSTTGSPPLTERAVTRACVFCPGTFTVRQLQTSDPAASPRRGIVPELDAAEIARKIGHPELEPVIEEKIAMAEAQVRSAVSDAQATAFVDALIADLDRLAKN